MISRLKEKIQEWNQHLPENPQVPEPEQVAVPEPLAPESNTDSQSAEPKPWQFAWVFPEGVYYCGMDHVDERLNQLVGLYENRAILDSDKLIGYCTFGEIDLVELSRERLLKLDKRFLQCSVSLASARVLWLYGLLSLDHAVLLQQGELGTFPKAVRDQLKELSVSEVDPGEERVALTEESLKHAVETGVGVDSLADTIAHLSDKSSLRRVTYWLSQCATQDVVEHALRLVDSLVACPVAKGLLPVASNEMERAEALAKIAPDKINLLQNLYGTVHLWALEQELETVQQQINELAEREALIVYSLPGYHTLLWTAKKRRQLAEQQALLEKRIKPFNVLAEGIKRNFDEKEQKRIKKQFQTLCQSDLGDEEIRQLRECIELCTSEQTLQELAGIVLALGLVARYPEETQFLTGCILRAAETLPGMDISEQMQLDAIESRLDTLDNISRLYLLSEHAVSDAVVSFNEEEFQRLSKQLTEGESDAVQPRVLTQNDLDSMEQRLEELKEQQGRVIELVRRLEEERPGQGDLIELIEACLNEGPKVRLSQTTPQERTLLQCVGLDKLMDQLLDEEDQAPSPLLYAMLQELQKLWEPMQSHGYFFVGYGIAPREPLKGGLDKQRYLEFTRTLDGTEKVDMVYPLFVNRLRQYANRYDWVRDFGEGADKVDPARVTAVLKALAAGSYTEFLDLFDSPQNYARHAGLGLERFNVLDRLRELITVQNASRMVTNFAQGQDINRKLDIAAVVLRNEAYRALNQLNRG